ncbi:MAG: TonB-dependent receptor [Deltaproteobacteria bacterium]|jgi:hemoglobin/transferrin/lactoferrin receptor protein|nr:TonB-dependent receptor [Deltaproteobacteria bacterium]
MASFFQKLVAAYSVLGAILGLSFANPASAQDDESSTIDAIVVTATRSERDLMKVPMSVTVVDDQKIEERYPGSNTAEKLRDAPGVSFSPNKSGPGNNSMLMIRGQNPLRVLYLIDGVSQNSVFKEDMNKGLLTIDPSDIERIEIIKGPASALYGSEAIGGVVNVITKKGGEGKPFGGRVDFTYDHSNRSYKPHLALYGDTDQYRYRLSGSYQDAGDRRAVTHGRLDHSGFSTESVFGNFGYTWDRGDVDITFSHYDSDVDEMSGKWDADGPVQKYLPYGHPDLVELSTFPANRRDTIIGNVVLRDLLPHLDQLSTKLSYQNRDTKQVGWQYPQTSLLSSYLADKTKTFFASVQGDLSFGSHEINVGLDYTYDKLKNQAQRIDYSIGGLTPLYELDATQQTLAFFAQDVWQIIDPLTLTTGLRYTKVNTDQGRLDEYPQWANRSYAFDNLVWNAGLVYQATNTLALRLQFAQGFRTPDLASKLTGTGGYQLPSPNISPETSESYEFGLRYNDNSLYVDAAVFYNNIDDFIYSEYLGIINNHYLWRAKNSAEYRTIGFEFDIAYTLGETGLTPYASYTYVDGRQTNKENGTYLKNISSPRTWGSVGLKWEGEVFDQTRLFADLIYRSSAKYTYVADGTVMFHNRSGRTMDLNLGLDHGEDQRFKLVLSVKNLLNEAYEPAYYHYPSRYFVVSASYLF